MKFKSVFTKYMVAFAVIILISFLLLAAIIGTIINNYAVQNKTDANETDARNAALILELIYRDEGAGAAFQTFMQAQEETLNHSFDMYKKANGEVTLLMVTTDGIVVYSAGAPSQQVMGQHIPPSVMYFADASKEVSVVETLDGLLDGRQIISISPIESEIATCIGYVFSCVPYRSEGILVNTLMRTIFTSCLWMMLAALTAVYFISDRMTGPLRTMTTAARELAMGKMSTRVDVQGRDEISELAEAFNHMAESLARLETMRNSFLANVSHDLRTPMTTIAGFVDGMISGAIPPEKQSHYLTVVSSEVHRLSRLVQSLLDISRLESGDRKFTFIPFDICELARLILISFEQKIEDKHLDVAFECDRDSMMVLGDKDAIHQVLYNICDNALKFSRDGGAYRITISSVEQDRVSVKVYNEGQGIPAEDIPYVFDKFYKSDKSRGLDKTGTGLGLYIAKTILEAHGEQISVRSEEGKYCEFTFTLKTAPND